MLDSGPVQHLSQYVW